MHNIGEKLKNAREEKGITLEQAEEDTKIRMRYLEALEAGEYSVIPGMVYAKGFLRNYANYLGLSQDEIMIEYKLLSVTQKDSSPKEDIRTTINKRRASSRSNRKYYSISLIIALIAVLTFAVYSMVFKNSPNATVNKDESKSKAAQQTPVDKTASTDGEKDMVVPGNGKGTVSPEGQVGNTGSGLSAEEPVIASGEPINLSLSGQNQVCWAKITVDGRVVFTGNIQPGETKVFSGTSKIKIRLGNAGAVTVAVNGQNIGVLGQVGQVAEKEFTGKSL